MQGNYSTAVSESHPARGAWIEIDLIDPKPQDNRSRTPQGVRGLKYQYPDYAMADESRTPQGVRGLKLTTARMWTIAPRVAPRKGCVD